MRQKKWLTGLSAMLLTTTLAACGDAEENQTSDATEEHSEHSMMDHSGSEDVPSGLSEATDPTFPVGATVMMTADHMPGMDGAAATIDSAEQTTVYMVDFTTSDGEDVTNHKWVTEDELEAVN